MCRFIQMRLILRCYVMMPATPRTARDFKFRFGILKFHRTALLDFAAKALAQTPPAAELLKFHREILKFSAEAFKPLALFAAALNLTKHDGHTKYDEQDERNEYNRRRKTTRDEPKSARRRSKTS